MLWMTLFVFSIENRVTYACFKHNVYVVTSKMADHSKCVQSILTTIWPYLNVSKLCIIMELTVSWKLPIKRVSSLLLCQVFFSLSFLFYCQVNWMAPWKIRISSTSMKLRKSLVKPVTRQNVSSCSLLSPEIVMHDAINVILWTSADICIVVHDDLGWKNRTTRYILPCHWLYEWFSSTANVRRYMRQAWRYQVKEPNNTL